MSDLLERARNWYDTTYIPWVNESIGGAAAIGGAPSLLGPIAPGQAGAPSDGKAGCLAFLDPAHWVAPWELWDEVTGAMDTPIHWGCGCLALLVLWPLVILWGLAMAIVIVLGLRPAPPTASDATGDPPLAPGAAVADPLTDWLLAEGVIRHPIGYGEWGPWAERCTALRGFIPRTWHTPLAFVMAGEPDWVQVQLRRDEAGSGVASLWTFIISEAPIDADQLAARLRVPVTAEQQAGKTLITIQRPPVSLPFSAAPVSWVEVEKLLRDHLLLIGES